MLFRVGVALLLSAVLIGGATWVRVAGENDPAPALIGVESVDNGQVSAPAGTEPEESPGETVPDNLTTTDLIGRQLMLDYVNLATSGGATDESLIELAEAYVDKIPSINSAPRISLLDIKTGPNTLANMRAYGESLVTINKGIESKIQGAYQPNVILTNLGNPLYSLAGVVSSAYSKAAEELRTLPAPTSMAEEHLRLINNYLAQAEAMRSLTLAETDATIAFAGMISLESLGSEQSDILSKIDKILTDNGI